MDDTPSMLVSRERSFGTDSVEVGRHADALVARPTNFLIWVPRSSLILARAGPFISPMLPGGPLIPWPTYPWFWDMWGFCQPFGCATHLQLTTL